MDDKEFKDLQLFGNTLEKKSTNHTKNIKKNQNNSIRIKPKSDFNLITFLEMLKKKAIFLICCLLKIARFILVKLKEKQACSKNRRYLKKLQKRKQSNVSQKNRGNIKKAYRIVETCKRRRNKIIIIRKRVLVPFESQYIQPTKADIPALFYLTFKDDEQGKQMSRPEAYTILKKSAWDFPVKHKK